MQPLPSSRKNGSFYPTDQIASHFLIIIYVKFNFNLFTLICRFTLIGCLAKLLV